MQERMMKHVKQVSAVKAVSGLGDSISGVFEEVFGQITSLLKKQA